jgi:hypothetical protein
MKKNYFLQIISLFLLLTNSLSATSFLYHSPVEKDSVDKQLLFNGRVWRNLYPKVRGDQFLFSSEFLPGTVSINGKTFTGCSIRYDIFNDEVLTRAGQNIIIQLNKEMVTSFTIDYNMRSWAFSKVESDTVNGPGGYACLLYDGENQLFVKYRKIVMLLAVDNKYDAFELNQKIWLRKNGRYYQLSGVNDVISLYKNDKQQINNYIRSHKLKVSRKNPESFIPLIEFCDKIGK